jgi:hypothetical protein
MKFIGVQENRPDEDWKHHISGIISATKSGESLPVSILLRFVSITAEYTRQCAAYQIYVPTSKSNRHECLNIQNRDLKNLTPICEKYI